MTFDLAEIEEMIPQQARKQLEAELETNCCNLGGVCCLYTAVLVHIGAVLAAAIG